MLQAINYIQDNLVNLSAQYRLIENTVNAAYQIQDNEYLRIGNSLYVTVKFHLAPMHAKFDLYNIHNVAFEFPAVDNRHHSVQITNLPNYILLPQQDTDELYLTFSERPNIDKKMLAMDEAQTFFQNKSEPTCLVALITNDLQMVKDTCQTDVLLHAKIIRAKVIDTDLIFLNDVDEYFIRCANHTDWTRYDACTLCRIKLQPCCQFKSHGLTYYGAATKCSNTTSINTLLTYVAPLHILINTHDLEAFQNLSADFIFNEPVNTSIPGIDLYNTHYSQEYSKMSQVSLDVNTVLNKSRNGMKLFWDLAHEKVQSDEALTATRLLNAASLLNFQSIIVFTQPFIIAGLIVTTYLLYKKLERQQNTILLMSHPNARFAMQS